MVLKTPDSSSRIMIKSSENHVLYHVPGDRKDPDLSVEQLTISTFLSRESSNTLIQGYMLADFEARPFTHFQRSSS